MRISFIFVVIFTAQANAGTHWVTPDFFVRTEASSSRPRAVTDCRANIKNVICLVEPLPASDEPQVPPAVRTCLAGGEAYAAPLERLYDEYPAHLQRMFCSLRHIYVEKGFEGSAYAGLSKNAAGESVGAVLGIRQSLLEPGQSLSLSFWASWKEQLSFGGILDRYELTAGLPLVDVERSSTPLSNDFLHFVIAHEFGHIFDFANGVNQFACPLEENRECDSLPNTWSSLAWRTNLKVRPEADFFGHEHLCFYWCKGANVLKGVDADQVYSSFYERPFISLYGSTNAWDDFAETVAYLAIRESFGARYVIRTGSGASFDISSKLANPRMAAKVAYVRAFFARGDLRYP